MKRTRHIARRKALPLVVSLFVLVTADQRRLQADDRAIEIDVHCHIFNGEDVPLDGFIEKVVFHVDDRGDSAKLVTILSRPIHSWVKFWADGHRQDDRDMTRLLMEQQKPVPPPLKLRTRNKPIEAPRIDLDHLYDDEKSFRENLAAAVESEPDVKPLFLDREKRSGSLWDVAKIGSWFRRFTSPRYANATKLRKWHGREGIDLFVPALVDLDYWLKGTTKSHLEEQVLITSKISIAMDGCLLPFVGFDPYRNAINEGVAFQIVQEAVLNYGFVGVKLYPPVGFRPIGNVAADFVGVEDAGWRDAGLTDKEFAQGLNDSLRVLYEWCVDHDVPVMAHCNDSNFSTTRFRNASHPKHWRKVLTEFPRLRLNLAHFGGTESLLPDDEGGGVVNWALPIAELMKDFKFVYADTGNFKLRKKTDRFSQYLRNLRLLIESYPVVAQRLMYGSDWFMHATRSYSKSYPRRFRSAVKHTLPAYTEDIMGGNAIDFLGLRKGAGTRRRLDAFYEKYGVSAEWRTRIARALRSNGQELKGN